MPLLSRLSALALGIVLAGSLGACSHCSSTACAADAQIASAVNAAIDDRPALHADDINVNVRDGVVYLNGLVDTVAEASQAELVAQSQPGVRQVVNLLQERNAW